MARWDYFSGASQRWRTDAKIRARLVIAEHPEDPIGYAEKRIRLSTFGSFQLRRWSYIRKVLLQLVATEMTRREPQRQH